MTLLTYEYYYNTYSVQTIVIITKYLTKTPEETARTIIILE